MAEPGCFHRGSQEGGSSSRNLNYFNIEMDLTIKYWTVLVPKTQLNTFNLSLIVIRVAKEWKISGKFTETFQKSR